MSTSGHHGARGTDGAALGVAHLELALTAATVDLLHGAVQRDGAVLHLTPLELRLLRHLVAVSPRPVDRAELEREVWGYAAGVDSHTVLSTVHRLRQKIERDPRRPDHLVTDRGRGYVLLAPTRSEPTAAASSLPFFGRAELVAAVVAAVGAHRLVSLVGTGGVGKTRLAREVVARLSQRPDDHPELRFIELAEATRAADVQHALGHALGVALAGKDPWTGLAHALESLARPVLVLDNLEQVLDAARAPIARLLGQVPRLAILATSREALGVDGERVVPVPALEPAEAEALFVDRHQRASPSASPITSADLAAIVEACEHLPLALFFGESPRGRAEAAGARAIAAWYRGDVEAGLRAAEVALRGYEALGVARRQVQVRLNRGYFLLDLGRHDEALRSLERGLEGARTGRLQRYLTGALSFIGMLHHDRGDSSAPAVPTAKSPT